MSEPADKQMARRFKDMTTDALKRKLDWHEKYAKIIRQVLNERKA